MYVCKKHSNDLNDPHVAPLFHLTRNFYKIFEITGRHKNSAETLMFNVHQ